MNFVEFTPRNGDSVMVNLDAVQEAYREEGFTVVRYTNGTQRYVKDDYETVQRIILERSACINIADAKSFHIEYK